MSNEFDIKQIDGYQFMSDEEKDFFEKYGNSISDQADLIADQHDIDSETMKEEYIYFSDSYQYRKNEYIVAGATLTCSLKTEKVQSLQYEGTTIESKPVDMNDMSRIIIPDDREETINGAIPVNVTDANGGLRDEQKELNIISFGNCQCVVDKMDIEDMAQKLLNSLENSNVNEKEILATKDKMKEAIEEGKGTCYCCMQLNPEWENMPLGYNFADGSFNAALPGAGINEIMMNESYLQFNGNEGINMMSMLFGRCGGIISALTSGQNIMTGENIWEDYEKDILNKFYSELAYENWSEEKKRCAEELWDRLYVKGDYDPLFVIGIIGNVFGEGSVGMLQAGLDWKSYGLDIGGYDVISNINQASIACSTPSGWGVGMGQWSFPSRKDRLLENYKIFAAEDGTLSQEGLICAECQTIKDEIDNEKVFKQMQVDCEDKMQSENELGEKIEYATGIVFKVYEKPESINDVDDKYVVANGVWDKAKNASKIADVPAICIRIIAAKVIYEEFGGR